jgi:aspartyl/asparaginyl beta-hydroxylase (cupin superfamily)
MAEVEKLEQYYSAKAVQAVLDGMPPGSSISRHRDQSKIYTVAHRVHLPIVTDPAVKFYIDGSEYHFKAGEFFEFNNRLEHGVCNESKVFRVHLVVDLLPI